MGYDCLVPWVQDPALDLIVRAPPVRWDEDGLKPSPASALRRLWDHRLLEAVSSSLATPE